MGTAIAGGPDAAHDARNIPTTGMRGGLGRILLTAFLILTIVPLGLTGGYAAQQHQQNLQLEMGNKLQAVATLKGAELERWVRQIQTLLHVSVSREGDGGPDALRGFWWMSLREQVPELLGLVAVDTGGSLKWVVGGCSADDARLFTPETFPALHEFVIYDRDDVLLFTLQQPEYTYVFCLRAESIAPIIACDMAIGETAGVYLVDRACTWPLNVCDGAAAELIARGEPRNALYVNHEDTPVVGAYYPLSDLSVGILVEQAQAETLASTDRIAATLIAMVLAVALATTIIAAIVIRQITRPVIQLTESAVAMAEGDLDQHLAVKSRDEIGILTYVFNEMAAELKSLYEDLEAKVVERTQRLQRANYQIQRRALHLQASQEIGQAITSIRDPAVLLNRVVDLIRQWFMYASVAVYLVEPGGGETCLRALSPEADEASGWSPGEAVAWPAQFRAGDGSVVDRAIRKRASQVEHQETVDEVEWYRRTLSRVAIPLRMEDRVMGTLAVLSTEREGIQTDEVDVLEILAHQVSVALENARAYERERYVTQQLEEAEAFKVHFLTNMSHELREPLNTIIGFSRLLIKGIGGDLNAQQKQDMEQIYNDSQHLLFLINDILTISQIQAGLMELKLQPVNFAELVNGVLPTAGALVRGKEIELLCNIADDLPLLRVDPIRIRQVLVHLFNNAAKFTEVGHIELSAWHDEDNVYVSISDTGVGVLRADRERIFNRFEKGASHEGLSKQGAGLGLSLCREFVEMHGGEIWMESGLGRGSSFTFSLPYYRAASPSAPEAGLKEP